LTRDATTKEQREGFKVFFIPQAIGILVRFMPFLPLLEIRFSLI
jgi:hypothetical protein